MEKMIKASVVYKCPKTNQKIQFKTYWGVNHYIHFKGDCYGSENYYIRIYKCKSCGKEHEIELN